MDADDDEVMLLQSLPSEAEDLVDELPIDQQPAAFPEIVRTKTFSLPPMTLEEALVQVCGFCCCCDSLMSELLYDPQAVTVNALSHDLQLSLQR